jgi:DNA-binding response OmpR family regulator
MKPDVLIVEDDENIRDLYKTALEQAGMRVILAADGAAGVALATEHQPKVIMMDIMMPVMDGHEAVRKIRHDDWGKTAKIIYLTNMSDASDVTEAIEQGSEEYIIKAHAVPSEVVNKVRIALHM